MTERVQISVIGGAEAEPEILRDAEAVGRGIAEAGAVLICGGLGGVMTLSVAVADRQSIDVRLLMSQDELAKR